MRWDRAELLNYSNHVPFPQIGCGRFSLRLFWLALFLKFPLMPFPKSVSHIFSHIGSRYESGPLDTPFMTVSTQRFAPNQYGTSR